VALLDTLFRRIAGKETRTMGTQEESRSMWLSLETFLLFLIFWSCCDIGMYGGGRTRATKVSIDSYDGRCLGIHDDRKTPSRRNSHWFFFFEAFIRLLNFFSITHDDRMVDLLTGSSTASLFSPSYK
jgi:hypothetical protein